MMMMTHEKTLPMVRIRPGFLTSRSPRRSDCAVPKWWTIAGTCSAFQRGIPSLSYKIEPDSHAGCTSIAAVFQTLALRHLIFACKKAQCFNHHPHQTEGDLNFIFMMKQQNARTQTQFSAIIKKACHYSRRENWQLCYIQICPDGVCTTPASHTSVESMEPLRSFTAKVFHEFKSFVSYKD